MTTADGGAPGGGGSGAPGGGGSGSSSGTPNPSPNPNPNPNPDDKVLHSTHAKVLSEKKKLGDENDSLKNKLAVFENQEKEKERKALEESGKYDEAIKLKDEEIAAKQAKLDGLTSIISNTHKRTTFLSAVGGDIEEKFWGLIDLNKITTLENGDIDQASLTKYAGEFVAEFGNEVVKRGNGARLPNRPPPPGGEEDGSGQITYEAWLLLPANEMRKRQKDVIKT